MASTTKKAKTPGERSKAEQALEFAKKMAPQDEDWLQLQNAMFGIGGKVIQLFPTTEERTRFAQTPEYKAIHALIDAAPDDAGEPRENGKPRKDRPATGAVLMRLPRSLHVALIAEAEDEGTSLNQLCVAKLAMQLKALAR